MKSMIFWGEVWHTRRAPQTHTFAYQVFTLGLDLDELEGSALPGGRLFAYNRRGVFSIRDRDYLQEGEGSLRAKLNGWLSARHGLPPPASVTLLTTPRLFGYVFNPVSFYVSRSADGTLHSVLTEVNNTFGEKHLYLLKPAEGEGDLPCTFEFPKEFFVSPFFPVDGDYRLTLVRCDADFEIRVDLVSDGRAIFSAILRGEGREMSRDRIVRTLLKYPLTLLVTMARIHKEAFMLYFRRSASIYGRPDPRSDATVRSRQNLLHRLRLAVLGLGKRRDDSGAFPR